MATKRTRAETIADVGEFGLIDRLSRRLPGNRLVRLGVGDDAAVIDLPKGRQLVASCDLLVEDVHFRRSTTPPRALGHKALAVNLSDLAAMGAEPVAALISLALPGDLRLSWVDAFYKGLAGLAGRTGTAIAGGDTTHTPGPIIIDLAVLGVVERGKGLRRDAARPGDGLWVCGPLGLSRAGLEALEKGLGGHAALKKAHREPRPLLKEGRALARCGRCGACIDVSDGLLNDLGHILKRSGVGAEIEIARLKTAPELARYLKPRKGDPVDYVLNGGEDYALLFTLRKGDERPGPWPGDASVPYRIGRVVRGRGIRIIRPDKGLAVMDAAGYDHFGRSGGFQPSIKKR